MLKKPNDFVEGLQQAINSIAEGVEDGITGIILQPYRGATDNGIRGFFQGSF